MKHLPIDQNMRRASIRIKFNLVFALLITLAVCCLGSQAQAGPPAIQTFFVPLPELQVQNSLNAVDTNNAIGNDMRTIISIAATGDNTILYYDHWEDGYEADMANPVQTSTEIWGDNDPANGRPPGFATDLINVGDIITLDNTVSLPRNPALLLYDGRDKFGGTKAVAVTRASWAVSPGVVLAGAVEVYPLRDYGLQFEVPVGEDLASDQMFQYVSLIVMAAADGTDIQIDIDGNGSTDITQTLNQGESYQVDGGIDTGASVTASNPVQAHIFTGDIGARYESRFYTLYPVDNWSDSYYSPVGTAADGDETYVFVYNPNASAITVNYETRIGSGSFVVAAGGSYRYLMPSQSGAHFFTDDGSTFFAIATVGADPGANLVHDWGFSLLPESYLTPIAVVGWGPGSDDLSQNGSPVWVTVAVATTVYVDYDGDPATGPLTDANGDHYDVALNLAMLESARVYDNSDNDQTGMKLYTLDGILITAAWGQDPANSLGGAPYLDLGTTVLPFPIASVEKTSAIVVDENSNGLIDWGDTLEYTIIVNNDGVVVLGGVVAFDWLPTGTEYVLGSTTLNGTPVADDTVPPAATEFPMDEGGLPIPVIPPTEFSTITFRVTVNDGTTSITNSVRINTDQEELNTEDSIDVNTPDVTACSLEFTDDGGVLQATYLVNSDIYVTVDDNDQNTDAGSIQSFMVVIVNSDSGDTETITLTETGNDTGVFRNTAALPSSVTGGLSHEDGTLYAAAGNTVQVAFRDPVFGDTCSDAAGIVIPTEIKPLYLSEPGQGMDRVDPVFTGDSTTANSQVIGFSSTGTTGMAVWSAAGIPEYNAWDGSSFTTTLGAITQTDRWRIMAGAAAPTRDEKIVVGIENSSAEISGELWNGSSWSKTSLTALANVSQTYWWGAEVAYEQQSGDAVLVWTGGTTYANQLRYQVWNGSSWTAPANIAAYTGSTPMQMRLAANPNSDEMVLVVNDSGENDYALVWNGSSWGNLQPLASSTADDRTDIFVAYEQQTGRAMVVYGNGTSSVYYRIWNGSIWSGANSVAPPAGVSNYARWTTLASDPSSNRIVMGVQSSDPDGWVCVWNGSAWETPELLTVSTLVLDAATAPNVGVAFESTSGQALAVYGRSSQNVFFYRTWINGSGWSGEQTGPNLGENSNSLILDSDPLSSQIMLAAQDDGSDINYVLWNGSSWGTPNALESTSGETKNQPFVFLYDQHIVPAGSSTTFTQSPVMCKDFVIPTGGAVSVTNYIEGSNLPADPDIRATIKHDGTTIKTLTNPSVTDLGAGFYQLDWTDVISSDTTVLAGEQVELETTTFEPDVKFHILYDSINYPSKILLPTTTVIVIHVDTLAANDAPYPGGSPVTGAQNGETLYLRATVSDPFGTNDITDLKLSIIEPCGGGPIDVILDDTDVVATGGCSKTYEYAWATGMCQGNYDIIAVASEGTEGITDSAAIRVTLSFTDTGTAGTTAFTDGSRNPVSNYDADATICVQVTDMDQNTNPGVSETLTAVVTSPSPSPQGDSETMILTETGIDTGIFRACIASSSSIPGAPNDGSLYALPGDLLMASYTDPDDASDTSNDNALVNIPVADMTLSKLLTDPADGTAVVNDLIRFDIAVGNPGSTNLTSFTVTDTFDAACMSYDAASIAPDTVGAGTLTWDETELGILPTGGYVTISVWFTADAACAPANNSVQASGQDQGGTPVSAGPATASVTINDPALSVTKTLISPNPGPAYVGDPVTFRITLQNAGTSAITTLPLADTFSDACYDYQTATVAPDGFGAGSLLWNNLGPLATSASISLDVTLTVTGECNPAQNTADVSFAVDENGDSVPPVQDSAGLQTIGAKIGDRVWNDRDGDGVQDVNEGGIANVIVFIDLNGDGSRDPGESYDTTDVNGAYDITDLAAGTYNVQVDTATLPAGVVLTGGSNPLSVTVAAGGDFNTADFGYQGNASIGDFIWDDSDGDGNQDGGELGLANVTVFLDADGDGVLDTGEPFVVTNGTGNFDFVNLAAGDYVVDVDDTTLPSGFTLTTGFHTLSVSLASGEDFNDADFGYQAPGTVTGHLFIDVNSNGVQDATEVGLVGVDIIITDSNLGQVTVTTDANGDYQASIAPGSTTLDVDNTTLPPGAVLTTANDSQVVTVNSGAAIASVAVGYHVPGPYLYQAHYRWRNDDGAEAITQGGDIAIYRASAADEAITTANFDHTWDTAVRQDSPSFDLEIDTRSIKLKAGHYLALYGTRFDSSGGSNRSEIQSGLVLNGLELPIGWSQGYMRRSDGDDEAFTSGGGIISVGSDDEILMLRSFRTDANATATALRAPNTSGIQLLRLDDSWDYCRLHLDTTQTGPNSSTWVPVQYNQQDELDTNSFDHSAGSADIILKSVGRYLVIANTYGATAQSSGDRTLLRQRLTLGAGEIEGTRTTVYIRGNTNSNDCHEGAASIGAIVDNTSPNQILNVELNRGDGTAAWTINHDGAANTVARTAITIVKLPDTADYIRLGDSGTDDMNPSSLAYMGWDTEHETSSSFIHTDNLIEVDADDDYLFLSTLYAEAAGIARAKWSQTWRKNGSIQMQYGQTGNYNRNSGANDTGNWSGIIFNDLVDGNTIEVTTQQLGNTGFIGADIKGLQGVRLSTLFATGIAGATFAAGEDVKLTGLAKQTPMRLRIMVSNEGSGDSGGERYQLYVAQTTDPTGAACPIESYQAVDDAGQSHWEMVDSSYITDGEPTFNIDPVITDEATTFVTGELKDTGDTTGSIALSVDEFTEIEFSIQATAAAPDAGEYCFKLVKDGSPDTDLDAYAIYGQVNLAGATAVDLLSFEAKGEGDSVKVAWQTANEINNMGFYLYRADTQDGPFTLLTDKLIPGADFTTLGQEYEYIDRDVTRGKIYYYRLVDVDTSGTRTDHGPICVDWDADGLPDDWEIAHGLDPTVDDADLDADNDGLTNLEEYERGSDPNNPDSDGDGIIDGDEHFQSGPTDPGGSLSLSRGVHILTTDETGITLELRTEAFETATIQVDGQQFEKLSIKEYVHGYTAEVGKPRLPLKGIMLDIPAGQSAQLTVLDTVSTIGYGYQVYPVPQNYADDQSYDMQVAELFTMDADAYGQDAFYPEIVAGLGEIYHFRDQLKQQLIFYPLSFNPVSGQIRHYNRIRVRIDYEDADLARVSNPGPQPWVPPTANQLLPNPLSMGPTAMAFIGPAFLNSPIISAIASLGTLAQAVWMPPDFDWTTQGPAYKILVADAGVYRFTGSYLAASGVDLTGVNIGQVRLYNLGTEIALTFYDENGDNGFDGNDYIEFYATAVDSEYAKYTSHNVYWLTLAGGFGAPLRMGVVDGSPAAGPDTAVHYFTVHSEPDQGYWQEAPGADRLDRWFIGTIALGDQIDSVNAGKPVSFNLPLVDVVDSATGTLKLMLYGGYDTDHEVRVAYEGEDLGTFAWSGYTNYEVIIEDVNFSEQIQDGNYTVSVTCLSGFDKIAFDWIAATYPREFMAYDDSLKFTHDPGYLFTIDDFSTDELMVLDITAADDPMRVQGFDIYEPEASSFSLEFETADDGQTHTYLVLAETEVKTTVAALIEDSASDLSDSANGADYILITHDDIGWDGSGQPKPWIDDLVTLRETQGLRVKLVNVQDIYDEFSYGLVTPEAIKDFLTYAYENWSVPATQYVLLVGDSSYDYKDNWGLGTTNYVPAYLTYTEFMGETVTDEWFVTIDGDDAAADMYIGRLPAKSAAEAQVMVDKIIAYETGPNTKTWEKNTLLVADDQEEAFESVFKTMNEDAAALLPTAMVQPYKGYLQDYLDAGFSPLDLNSDILDQINAGALIANFSGHGHLQGWADESIFDVGDINGLTNAGKYPFIVSMNCLTGYFAYPEAWTASFAEMLLRAEEKGTAAALMPTGMTTTEGQHVMNTALFETIFVEDVRRLGPAIARAKRELLANGDAYFEQISQTFLLFGDPAMQLRVPLPRRPSGLVPALWTKSGVALRWDAATDCNNDPVAGYNVYRSTSPTGNFTKINQAAITQPEYTDDTASASAAASPIYYYTVTAVDADGDESSPSAMAASPSLVTGTGIISSGGSGGGGGCFISTTMNSSAGIELSLLVGIGLLAILLLFHMNIYMKRAS